MIQKRVVYNPYHVGAGAQDTQDPAAAAGRHALEVLHIN